MVMSLIEKDKKRYTRFRLSIKEFLEFRTLLNKFGIDTDIHQRKIQDSFTSKKKETF